MSIPKNGRVVIVDDEINQALPIMRALSKRRLPFTYYSGLDVEDLPEPESGSNDIRLLFLDLNLGTEVDSKTDNQQKNYKSKMFAILNRIIPESNIPYLLIIWGREENHYSKYVQELFQEELKLKSPEFTLTLNKSDFFELDGSQKTTIPDFAVEIQQRLDNGLKDVTALDILLQWESLIHDAANTTLSEFVSLHQKDLDWNKNILEVIYKLAQAYSGKSLDKESETIDKIRQALLTFNLVFNDVLESNIFSEFTESKVDNLAKPTEFDPTIGAAINRRLLLSKDNVANTKFPGCVFKCEDTDIKPGKLMNDSFNREIFLNEIEDSVKEKTKEIADQEERIRAEKKLKNDQCSTMKREILELSEVVLLHVTPVCDYAQNKMHFPRILAGLVIPSSFYNYINTRADYLYISPIFRFNLKGQDSNYILIVDFRYLHAPNLDDLCKTTPLFRIRHQLLGEIQQKLANHVSRVGLTYIDSEV